MSCLQQAAVEIFVCAQLVETHLSQIFKEHEYFDETCKVSIIEQILLHPRRAASLESFRSFFHRQGPGMIQFPLLRAFLQYEDQLPSLSLLDILAWHRVVIVALDGMCLTREDARQQQILMSYRDCHKVSVQRPSHC